MRLSSDDGSTAKGSVRITENGRILPKQAALLVVHAYRCWLRALDAVEGFAEGGRDAG
jgi:hypothetical protein